MNRRRAVDDHAAILGRSLVSRRIGSGHQWRACLLDELRVEQAKLLSRKNVCFGARPAIFCRFENSPGLVPLLPSKGLRGARSTSKSTKIQLLPLTYIVKQLL
jgi:hypothetical protein